MQYESAVRSFVRRGTPSLAARRSSWTFPHAPACEMCVRVDLIPFVIKFQKSTLVHCHRPGAPALVAVRRSCRPVCRVSFSATPPGAAGRAGENETGKAQSQRKRKTNNRKVFSPPSRPSGRVGLRRRPSRARGVPVGVARRSRARQTIAHVFGGRRDVRTGNGPGWSMTPWSECFSPLKSRSLTAIEAASVSCTD